MLSNLDILIWFLLIILVKFDHLNKVKSVPYPTFSVLLLLFDEKQTSLTKENVIQGPMITKEVSFYTRGEE